MYLFVFTFILNLCIDILGIDKISAMMLGDTVFQPAIAALIGLIPNCAASVILTQLYLSGAISFSSVIAGLCTGAGIGLVVLFKVNPDKKENIKKILEKIQEAEYVLVGLGQYFDMQYFLSMQEGYREIIEKLQESHALWMEPYVDTCCRKQFAPKLEDEMTKGLQNLAEILEKKSNLNFL